MPSVSYGVLDHFPHDTYRRGQKELMRKIKESAESGIPFFILQAPTGTGKTSVAGALAKYFGSSYFLAEQKIHQRQIFEEFPDATSVCKGQLNYNCGEARTPPCDDAIPINDISCSRKPSSEHNGTKAGDSPERGELRWNVDIKPEDRCPYFKSKMRAMNATIACLNYSYFFRETYYSGDFGERRFMVCDEAHNIEDNLENFLRFRVDDFVKEEFGLVVDDLGGHISDWEGWIDRTFKGVAHARLDELDEKITKKFVNGEKVPNELLLKRDQVDEIICNIHRFLREYNEGLEWAVERTYDDAGQIQEVEFSPVSVAPFTERFLFDYADYVLLMSATILDYDIFLRQIGLSNRADEVKYFEVNSAFPPENRRIRYYDGPRINYDTKQNKLPKLSKIIDSICRKKHPDESGIIHTVSFENGELIRQNLSKETRDRVMHHNGDERNRDNVLENFKVSDDKVLMSPSMMEGVDLKHDESRFQILPKVPFLSLGSERVQMKKDLDPMWYNWRSAIKLIQSFGRSIRANDDYAETYILDGSFEWFLDRHEDKLFPDYIVGDENGSLEKGNIRNLL